MKTAHCPTGDRCHVGQNIFLGSRSSRIIGGGVNGGRRILVALTEDYLTDEERYWGIAHSKDLEI